MNSRILWGIDLGGTKIEGVAIAGTDPGKALVRTRVPTEESKGYEHILGRIAFLVAEMQKGAQAVPESIGLSHPGVLDPKTALIKNSNSQSLNGKPLKADLERALGIPFHLANDANCLAAAEARFGAARGASVVFAVILGTGVGGGIAIDGKVIHGTQGIAGEWGHNVLDEQGPDCYCGKKGCVEKIISGPALSDFYFSLTGERLPFAEIASRAAGNEPAAAKTIERLVENFGKAISVVINILDPDVVVLGGGVSNVLALYSEANKAIAKCIFNDRVETRIVQNHLGDSAGVFGAAALTNPN